ncbi:MAG: hypothetical protein MSC31_08735 [Solirubrobacteraceae bacterium MAG38_C4-C5]|nr:hypothetical protein [Candidatus Siliceabacter maunaloa]
MSSAVRRLDEGDVFVWTLDPDAEWAYSKFPARLITVDYDKHDRPIKVVAIGPEAERLERTVVENATDRLYELAQPDVAEEVNLALAGSSG